MKKIFLSVLLLFATIQAFTCPVCERNQPKILRGITHGAGPESKWDYVIVWIAIIIVAATLFFSIKWLIRPGERSDRHIKRFILNNE
ncbi:MAG: hypothetical protein JSS82_14115 [Bacteroidetes bacterium]|nr:hypothetical protein [Bacteroidota bacterium]